MIRSQIVVAMALALLSGAVFSDLVSPELVQVGNLRIEAKIEGTGPPAVIFESGFTGGLVFEVSQTYKHPIDKYHYELMAGITAPNGNIVAKPLLDLKA